MNDNITDEVLSEFGKDRKWLDEHMQVYRGVVRLNKGRRLMDESHKCDRCNQLVNIGWWAAHRREGCNGHGKESLQDFVKDIPKEILIAYDIPLIEGIDRYAVYKLISNMNRRGRIDSVGLLPVDLIPCPCGASIISGTEDHHVLTRRHQRYLVDKQTIDDYVTHMISTGKIKKDDVDESITLD